MSRWREDCELEEAQRHDSLKLLAKLLLFVRIPNDDGTPNDDFQPCYAHNISKWNRAWDYLNEEGYVETQLVNVGSDEDLAGKSELVVAFKQKGLDHAINQITPEATITAQAQKKTEDAGSRNQGREGFGLF